MEKPRLDAVVPGIQDFRQAVCKAEDGAAQMVVAGSLVARDPFGGWSGGERFGFLNVRRLESGCHCTRKRFRGGAFALCHMEYRDLLVGFFFFAFGFGFSFGLACLLACLFDGWGSVGEDKVCFKSRVFVGYLGHYS